MYIHFDSQNKFNFLLLTAFFCLFIYLFIGSEMSLGKSVSHFKMRPSHLNLSNAPVI